MEPSPAVADNSAARLLLRHKATAFNREAHTATRKMYQVKIQNNPAPSVTKNKTGKKVLQTQSCKKSRLFFLTELVIVS